MSASSHIPGVFQSAPFGDRILTAFSGRQFPREKRNEFLASLDIAPTRAFFLNQVHGNEIVEIRADSSDTSQIAADGIISNVKGAALGIRTADCMPVFFADRNQTVVGLAHAGWRGLHQGILEKMVGLFDSLYQVKASEISLMIGPAIRACCYEVGEEFCGYFPQACISLSGEKPKMNLVEEAFRRMAALGVPSSQMTDSGICTACQNHLFFSARKEKTDQRIFSVIQLIA